MIQFFDLKHNVFCEPGYNEVAADGSTNKTLHCMGRDLRLSDLSKEDLDIWKQTGFFQMCGTRDRAKRAILAWFVKVIAKESIPIKLFARAYLYACDLLCRDESIQKTGFVLIGYAAFNHLHLRGPITDSRYETKEASMQQYLTKIEPNLRQLSKVELSIPLRAAARHLCYDQIGRAHV